MDLSGGHKKELRLITAKRGIGCTFEMFSIKIYHSIIIYSTTNRLKTLRYKNCSETLQLTQFLLFYFASENRGQGGKTKFNSFTNQILKPKSLFHKKLLYVMITESTINFNKISTRIKLIC